MGDVIGAHSLIHSLGHSLLIVKLYWKIQKSREGIII